MAHCQTELDAYLAAAVAAAAALVAADIAYAAWAACEASHEMLSLSETQKYIVVRLKMGDSKDDIKKSLMFSHAGK